MALSKRTNLSSNSDKKASNSNALPALPFKNTITMVLLGETGAGKSALINLFHFWSLESLDKQPKFKDAAGHSIIRKENEAGGSQSGSQTLKPSHYQFDLKFGERTYCFSILDTPGMGDIKGLKNDDDNILAILKMIEETPSVDGIMLMLNGSNCRVSSRTQYILQRLYGMCPKTFEDHLYLIFSNTQLIPNFDWKNEIKVPIHKENVIPFDNLLYSPAGLQYETLTAIQRTKIEKNYEENKAILSLMFDQLIRVGALRPDVYKNLRENRDKLRVRVSGILMALSQSHGIKGMINEELQEMNSAKPKRDLLLKKSQMTTEQVHIMQKDTPYHNTQCLTCSVVCHEKCGLNYTAVPGHDIFQGCACMQGDRCGKCNHDYTTHAHAKFIYDRQIIKKPLINEEESRQLKSMTNEMDMKKFLIEKLQGKLNFIDNQIDHFRNDLKAALRELKDLCPHYDYKLELRCAIELLKEAKRVGNTQYSENSLQELEDHFKGLIDEFDRVQTV